LVLAAAALRFYDLPLAPLHHDEGVNGNFLTNLFRHGLYHYDPANYHGPSLYYLALPIVAFNSILFGKAGLSTAAIRSLPAVFGTATVYLVLQFRQYLGRWGALGAAALLAFSPGALYYSRYFIHETLFVFFTLAIVFCWLRYRETGGWDFLLALAAALAFLCATKETAVISLVVLVLAYLCATAWIRMWGPAPERERGADKAKGADAPEASNARGMKSAGSPARAAFARAGVAMPWLAVALFAVIYVLLFSSFGTHFRGVYDSFVTFRYWFKTGVDNTLHDRFTYVRWLAQEDWLLLFSGAAAFAWALYRARNRFTLFAGFWAAGMLMAYSLIPYKTPWLALNILLPLALVAGGGFEELVASLPSRRRRTQTALVAVPLVALVFSACHAVDISFVRYDDDSVAYVYAHTRREFLSLVTKIEQMAALYGTRTDTHITIASPDYWPLPWYLRNYPNTGYWGHIVPTQEPMVIGRDYQVSELQRTLGSDYQWVGSYDLRPGVGLVLFCRRIPQSTQP
jgi:uncharacterized protein (TIGR03663 family)